ncbi:MAG: T9SS type A sorting domain-containing protein [Agriterribacter sp.]
MKKVFTIAAALVLSFQLSYAQGVKQLWTTTWEDQYPDVAGLIISFDSVGNNFQKRHEFLSPPPAIPLSLNYYNGKFYSIVGEVGNFIEYDPLTNQRDTIGQLAGSEIAIPVFNAMTMKDGVFYGVSSRSIDEVNINKGYIYTLDPATHEFTIKYERTEDLPTDAMIEKNGKWYGLCWGSIFEWNPINNEYTTKINFPNLPSFPEGDMVLWGDKFYGVWSSSWSEDTLYNGCLFEWDPVSNDFIVKYDFSIPEDGSGTLGKLVEMNGKLYGTTSRGGADDAGVLFEFDPAAISNGYSKKADLTPYNSGATRGLKASSAGNLYGYRNGAIFEWNSITGELSNKTELPLANTELLLVSAPVALPTPGNCENYPTVQVDQANNNRWVPITDSKGDVLVEIQPNENNLGTINIEAYIHNGAIRKDGQGHPYLDRNITITPQNTTIADPVELRLYITKAEFEVLKADPASGITDISDLAIFKSTDACSGALITSALPIPTTYEDYEFGYVLKASVSSFSTFYFSNRTFEALPLQFIDFTAIQKGGDALLQWITENEVNTKDFAVEKSMDGVHFTSIGNVAAKNTTGKQSYNFTDKNIDQLNTGTVYYRLKQNDIDGNTDYSKTVSIHLSNAASLKLSPNPAGSVINLTYKKTTGNNAIVQIIDADGKKVLEQRLSAQTANHKININALAKGVYLISVIDNGERLITRFVKQ